MTVTDAIDRLRLCYSKLEDWGRYESRNYEPYTSLDVPIELLRAALSSALPN